MSVLVPVIQRDATGCAIASAAALAGLSYAETKRTARALGIRVTDPALWSDTKPMRALLSELGFEAGARRPFRRWQALPDRALLAVKWHRERGRPRWHWVVFARLGARPVVLDSKRSLRHHVRTDFGRIKPKWFMEVRRG